MHNSVLGWVPGALLQANYIESILDGRYFRQGNGPLQIGLSFVFFALIELIFEHIKSLWLPLTYAVLLVAMVYSITFMAIVQWAYYFDLWTPTAVAVVLKFFDRLRHGPSSP